ncbi:hypothetical protein ABZ733_35680 [Streptomyces longwoodensis]|uniref:SCO2400 family protein n=1 Tax=Streptomyces longwoodensis TaxID=68231 RepID=UPI0033C9B54A
MDYCSACRRHLNGALVCPGCGAYAPDIAPPGTEGRRPFAVGDAGGAGGADGGSRASGRPGRAALTVPRPPGPAGPTDPARPRGAWDDVSRAPGSVLPPSWHEEDADGADDADHARGPDTGDVSDAPPAPQGRAARRRQRVRWKKSQRRAVVATAVALVGGGLTLASLDRHAPDRTQAAAAPDDRAMGAAREQVRDDDAGGNHVR